MRIQLDDERHLRELVTSLRAADWVISEVDERTIDAAPRPQSLAADAVAAELEADIALWSALNPHASVTITDPAESGERVSAALARLADLIRPAGREEAASRAFD